MTSASGEWGGRRGMGRGARGHPPARGERGRGSGGGGVGRTLMACFTTSCQISSTKQPPPDGPPAPRHLSVRLFSKCLGDKKKFCGEALPGNAVVRRRVQGVGGQGGGGGEGRLCPAMQWCVVVGGQGRGEAGRHCGCKAAPLMCPSLLSGRPRPCSQVKDILSTFCPASACPLLPLLSGEGLP